MSYEDFYFHYGNIFIYSDNEKIHYCRFMPTIMKDQKIDYICWHDCRKCNIPILYEFWEIKKLLKEIKEELEK